MGRQFFGAGSSPAYRGNGFTAFNRPFIEVKGVVPTGAGTGTGTIVNPAAPYPAILHVATNGTGNADDIVILPEPIVGTEVIIVGGNAGYELRSSNPATVAINGGTGADAESAIAVSLTLWCRCISPTAWLVNNFAAAGTEAAEEAAA